MASSLDMALDDIITTNKSRPKAQRGKGRGNQRSTPYSRGGKGLTTKSGATEGSKIMISNLHYNVNEADLRVRFFAREYKGCLEKRKKWNINLIMTLCTIVH